jgi:hypothetical protein
MLAKPADNRAYRPFGFRLILLETMILSMRGWGRIWVVIDQRERYQHLESAPSIALYIVVNGLWGILFALMVFGLWKRRRWINPWLWKISLTFALFSVGWFWAFAQSTYDRDRFPFLLIVLGLGLTINFWLIRRPQFRTAFQPTLASTQNNLEN